MTIKAQVLSSLLQSKQSLVEALINLQKASPPWLRYHISKILRNLEIHAKDYGRAFSTGLFSKTIEKRIQSYARRASFNDAMERIGSEGMVFMQTEMEKASSKINLLAIALVSSGKLFFYGGSLLTAKGLTNVKRDSTDNLGIKITK